nr:immunoglobulin light chain junction region [Macaca mulatta]MOX83243.1 immunoglobulin light chain junction region [Macaca mulatta]
DYYCLIWHNNTWLF